MIDEKTDFIIFFYKSDIIFAQFRKNSQIFFWPKRRQKWKFRSA